MKNKISLFAYFFTIFVTSYECIEMHPRSTKRANKEMEERLRVFEKKVEAQRFVMTNLRNGIDYLKDQGLKNIPR